MSQALTENPVVPVNTPQPVTGERKGLTKKEIAADHPTWCPGCGDFSILALYFKLIEKRKLWHEKITTISGIGCSSRFPYFVQAHGATFFTVGRSHLPVAFRCPGPICTFLPSAATAMLSRSAAIISPIPHAKTSR